MAKLNVLQLDDACKTCIRNYAKKHGKKPGDSFDLPCRGIPKDFAEKYDTQAIENEGGLPPEMILDPVIWAREFLDWNCLDPDREVWKRKDPATMTRRLLDDPDRPSPFHRPDQAVMLRCTSQQKVFRIGRQFGKCLVSGTKVAMADGTLKNIEEVQNGDMVLSYNDNYEPVSTMAFMADNGMKPVLGITLSDGRYIEATENHPFLRRRHLRKGVGVDEWVDADLLEVGDMLAVPRKSLHGTQEVDRNEALVLAGLIADGNMTSNNLRFSNINEEILSAMKTALQARFNSEMKSYDADHSWDYNILGDGAGKAHPVKEWLKGLDLYGKDSFAKAIPDSFMRGDEKAASTMLAMMYGCDGWASVDKNGRAEIGYSTSSDELAEQVVSLLARFGIYTTKSRKKVKYKGKTHLSWQISVFRKEDILTFAEQIGILGKGSALQKVVDQVKDRNPSNKVAFYTEENLCFIRVKDIAVLGTKQTWDLSVPETKNFVANNIITHNTEVLVISMLYGVLTNNGFRIVLLTPFKTQVEMIFKRMEELLLASPMKDQITRNTKNPFVLEFKNGSMIRGFTAGTKSGSDAGSVRGQSANMLVFDEADFLSPGDIQAAMSIVTNFPDATVWMSSTPIGKREQFYDRCHDDTFKEFHFQSYRNPNWTKKLETTYRRTLTEAAYEHEIEAEFGEQEAGVFKNAYVDRAFVNYAYGDFEPDPNWEYSIGVDWNSAKVGTTIFVLGMERGSSRLFVVEKRIVKATTWTQLKAIEAIMELNRKWKPFSIQVDKGYGATQIEILRAHGRDALRNALIRDNASHPHHQDSKLLKIVEPYDFGGAVEVLDPVSNQKIKKPAKGYLVETSVRQFEHDSIAIPMEDEQMKAELLNYIVKSVSVAGALTYGQNNEAIGDHQLDAMMLAIMAFQKNKSIFGKRPKTSGDEITMHHVSSRPPGFDNDEDAENIDHTFSRQQRRAGQTSRGNFKGAIGAGRHALGEGKQEKILISTTSGKQRARNQPISLRRRTVDRQSRRGTFHSRGKL